MIKEGFYENGIFRFILEFPQNFPSKIPLFTFKSSIYHPMISNEGILDLDSLFPEWSLSTGNQLINLLTKVRSALSEKQFFENENSFNPEAAFIFKKTPEIFLEKTLESAKQSKITFYKLPDDCPYKFDQLLKVPEDIKNVLENQEVS